jgi:hypothetical protein
MSECQSKWGIKILGCIEIPLAFTFITQYVLFCEGNDWYRYFDASQLALQRTEVQWHMIKT